MSEAVLLFRPEGPAESSTLLSTATIARPCPSCPIWRSSRTPSTPRWPGRSIVRAEAPAPLAVRGTPAELQALVGQELRGVRRRGKFIVLDLERDRIAINAMLTGRFQLAAPGDKRAAEHRRDPRLRPAAGRGRATPRPGRAGASWLPADADAAEVRYRDPSQMGKVYLAARRRRAGRRRARRRRAGAGCRRPGAHARGLARADPAAPGRAEVAAAEPGVRRRDRQCLQRRDPPRGEAAARSAGGRRSPPRRSTRCTRRRASTLARAISVLRERVPPTFEKQVRDFLAVHRRGGEACPRCGTRLSEVSSRSEATTWCRGCQR